MSNKYVKKIKNCYKRLVSLLDDETKLIDGEHGDKLVEIANLKLDLFYEFAEIYNTLKESNSVDKIDIMQIGQYINIITTKVEQNLLVTFAYKEAYERVLFAMRDVALIERGKSSLYDEHGSIVSNKTLELLVRNNL